MQMESVSLSNLFLNLHLSTYASLTKAKKRIKHKIEE